MVQEPSNLYLAAASPACRASQVAGQQSVGAWPGTCSSRAEQALRAHGPPSDTLIWYAAWPEFAWLQARQNMKPSQHETGWHQLEGGNCTALHSDCSRHSRWVGL